MSNKGFSLSEVMVSVLLLMGGLLATAQSTASIIEANYRTNLEALASAHAQQKIEFLKTVLFTHGDLSDGTHSEAPAAGFTRTWTATPNALATQKTVIVSVTAPVLDSQIPAKATFYLIRSQ